jgi:hypothetical protein
MCKILFVTNGVIQLTSGVFLTFSVIKIRHFLKENGFNNRINMRNFALHALCFGFYLCSIFTFYVGFRYVLPSSTTDGSSTWLAVLFFFYILTAFFEQVLLIVILLQFANLQKQNRHSEPLENSEPKFEFVKGVLLHQCPNLNEI